MQPSARCLIYALLTCLVLMCGAISGFLAVAGRRASLRKESMEAIIDAGGYIVADGSLDIKGSPGAMSRLAQTFRMRNVKKVVLDSPRANDQVMSDVRTFSEIRSLCVRGDISDEGMAQLGTLDVLDSLDVGLSKVTGQFLKDLKSPNLVTLVLYGTKIYDDDLAYLVRFPQLKELNLAETCVGDPGLKRLAALRALRSLNLSGCRVSNTGLYSIGALKQLRTLVLLETDVSTLQPLKNLSNLERLTIMSKRMDDEGLRGIEELISLRYVSLWTPHASDEILHYITALPNLKHLDLAQCGITDKGVALLKCPKGLSYISLSQTKCGDGIGNLLKKADCLEEADFSYTLISDASIPVLAKLTKCRLINLRGSLLTSFGVASLRSQAPWMKILD